MKRLLCLAVLLFGLGNVAHAQSLTRSLTAQGAECGAANASSLILKVSTGVPVSQVAFALSGTFSGTVTFKATANGGATWTAFSVTPAGGGSGVTTATGVGNWSQSAGAYTQFCALVSTYSSGTFVATINLSNGSSGGSGTVSSCATFGNGNIPFYIAATTLGCNDQLQWNNTNNFAYTGVPQSTFEPAFQNYLGANPAKVWIAQEAGTQFAGLFVQSEGITGAIDPVYFATNVHNQSPFVLNSDLLGTVDLGQTVSISKQFNPATQWNGPGTLTLHQDYYASPNYTAAVQVGTSDGYYANFVTTGTGELIGTANGFRAGTPVAGAGTATNVYGFHAENQAVTGATITAAVKIDAQTPGAANFGILDAPSNLDSLGLLKAVTYSTATNCSSSATPAVCGSAAAGAVALPTGTGSTLTINTSAVTANSEIRLQIDDSLTVSGATCNTTLATLVGTTLAITARSAGVSFTVSTGASTVIATNPVCFSYTIVN